MDRILTAEAGLIDNEFDSKSSTDDAFLSCLPVESFARQKDENNDQFHQGSVTDSGRAIIHRMHPDDISRELPANILDTDSYDKNEDSTICERSQMPCNSSTTDISSTECNLTNKETKFSQDSMELDVPNGTSEAMQSNYNEPSLNDETSSHETDTEIQYTSSEVGTAIENAPSSIAQSASKSYSKSAVDHNETDVTETKDARSSQVPIEIGEFESAEFRHAQLSGIAGLDDDLLKSGYHAAESGEVDDNDSVKSKTVNLMVEGAVSTKIQELAESNEVLDPKEDNPTKPSNVENLDDTAPFDESLNLAENDAINSNEIDEDPVKPKIADPMNEEALSTSIHDLAESSENDVMAPCDVRSLNDTAPSDESLNLAENETESNEIVTLKKDDSTEPNRISKSVEKYAASPKEITNHAEPDEVESDEITNSTKKAVKLSTEVSYVDQESVDSVAGSNETMNSAEYSAVKSNETTDSIWQSLDQSEEVGYPDQESMNSVSGPNETMNESNEITDSGEQSLERSEEVCCPDQESVESVSGLSETMNLAEPNGVESNETMYLIGQSLEQSEKVDHPDQESVDSICGPNETMNYAESNTVESNEITDSFEEGDEEGRVHSVSCPSEIMSSAESGAVESNKIMDSVGEAGKQSEEVGHLNRESMDSVSRSSETVHAAESDANDSNEFTDSIGEAGEQYEEVSHSDHESMDSVSHPHETVISAEPDAMESNEIVDSVKETSEQCAEVGHPSKENEDFAFGQNEMVNSAEVDAVESNDITDSVGEALEHSTDVSRPDDEIMDSVSCPSDVVNSAEPDVVKSNEIPNSACETSEPSTKVGYLDQESGDFTSCPKNELDATFERSDGFIPTIVDIRGACTSTAVEADKSVFQEKSNSSNEPAVDIKAEAFQQSELPQIEIRGTQGNFSQEDGEGSTTVVPTYTIEDGNDRRLADEEDLMYVGTQHASSCFTSELDIEEEKLSSEDGKPEVFCIESHSKIPSPIPIKTEPNVDVVEKLNSDLPHVTAKKRTSLIGSARKESPLKFAGAERNNSFKLKDLSRATKEAELFSHAGYSCHLCNTTFQEPEKLNEHMMLHRNNSLSQSRLRKIHRRMKPFQCTICHKQLSTPKSLIQHHMIHTNEKPFSCSVCRRDFRHQGQLKQHLQRHSSEELCLMQPQEKSKTVSEPEPVTLVENAVRDVDFGKLVGPLFVKETFLNIKSKELKKEAKLKPKEPEKQPTKPQKKSNFTSNQPETKALFSAKLNDLGKRSASKVAYAVKRTSRVSFDKPLLSRKKYNTKENQTCFSNTIAEISRTEPVTRSRVSDDVDDDVIPLKTFNNVENIVMNAARYIVKLDNLDPSILKRKIKTPDISIDKSSSSLGGKRVGEKRRIVLSPPDPAKRLKLDQIENIIMDEVAPPVPENAAGRELESDSSDDYPDMDEPAFSDGEDAPSPETMTRNELLQVLGDSPGGLEADKPKPLRSNAQTIAQSEAETARNQKYDGVRSRWSPASQTAVLCGVREQGIEKQPQASSAARTSFRELSSSTRTPNVLMTKVLVPSKRAADPSVPTPAPEAKKAKREDSEDRVCPLVDLTAEADPDEADSGEPSDPLDAFDKAFQKVAQRRLLLIRNRAALNEGKVESRYLLGPLFWRKALRRARLDSFKVCPNTSELKLPATVGRAAFKFGRLDERRTNDPAKLQARAESKLNAMLNRIKRTNDPAGLNLVGPLFWRRTLRLAGVHRPDDLPALLSGDRLSLGDIQFVDEKLPVRRKAANSDNDASKEGMSEEQKAATVADFLQPLPQAEAGRAEDEDCDPTDDVDSSRRKLVDSILHDALSLSAHAKPPAEPVGSNCRSTSATTLPSSPATDSILYDSLTRPRSRRLPPAPSPADSLTTAVPSTSSTGTPEAGKEGDVILIDSDHETSGEGRLKESGSRAVGPGELADVELRKRDSKLSTRLTERYKMDVSRGAEDGADAVSPAVYAADVAAAGDGAANIILNVDGNLQLIAQPDAAGKAGIQDGTNYVLVSDETGAMQLVKEHDLRLMEGNLEPDAAGDGGGAPQYVVNVQGENYGNLELIGDSNGEQLTYALQFDGENYTAVQFVQSDEEMAEKPKTDQVEKVALKEESYIVPETTPDLNHIGKELSDFLNLDYGTLLKNEGADQAQT